MNDSLLSIQNLRAWYNKDKEVLSDFSFDLMNHEVALHF